MKKSFFTDLCRMFSLFLLKKVFYSVRSATTGSFFAALAEGIMPAISVKTTLMPIRISATGKGKIASRLLIPVRVLIIKFMGNVKIYVTTTPKSPDVKPMITVSALNIPETSFLDAPIARRIPISFVLS